MGAGVEVRVRDRVRVRVEVGGSGCRIVPELPSIWFLIT